MTFRLIIAGSRTFTDYELLKRTLDKLLINKTDIEIVSGCAKGADKLGERYAAEHNYPVKHFPADWDAHGKGAGFIRNKQMAQYADALVAFWDGFSRGTEMMIELAREKNLLVRVIRFAIK